jgi:hypothetical protein
MGMSCFWTLKASNPTHWISLLTMISAWERCNNMNSSSFPGWWKMKILPKLRGSIFQVQSKTNVGWLLEITPKNQRLFNSQKKWKSEVLWFQKHFLKIRTKGSLISKFSKAQRNQRFLCDMAVAATADLHPTVEAASSSNHQCSVSLPKIYTHLRQISLPWLRIRVCTPRISGRPVI